MSECEIIVKMDKHIKIKGGSYIQDLIRCKDCKYATYDKSIDRYDCRNWGLDGDEYTEADDFCSYGERAES